LAFKIKFSDAKLWRRIVEAVSVLVDEAVFKADNSSLRARAMDPSHVAMVDVYLPAGIFDEYECSGEAVMGVSLDEMSKIVRRAGGGDELEMVLDEEANSLRVRLKGAATRTFKISLLDLGAEEPPTPSITFNTEVKLITNSLVQALKDAELFSDHVEISATPEGVFIAASGDTSGVEVKIDRGSEALLELNVTEPSRAIYALSYLTDMIKAAAISDTVTLQFSTNMPLKLEFRVLGEGKVTYWLAPRIEAE